MKQWCLIIDNGQLPANCLPYISQLKQKFSESELVNDSKSDANNETSNITETASVVAVMGSGQSSSAVNFSDGCCNIPDLKRLLANT